MASTSSMDGVAHVHFSHGSVIYAPSLANTTAADSLVRPSIAKWYTKPLLDPWHALCASWMELLLSPPQQTAQGYLPNFLANTRDQEFGILHVDTEPITFHASLPCLELGDTFLLGLRYEHPVISIEEFPQHTRSEPMHKHHQDFGGSIQQKAFQLWQNLTQRDLQYQHEYQQQWQLQPQQSLVLHWRRTGTV